MHHFETGKFLPTIQRTALALLLLLAAAGALSAASPTLDSAIAEASERIAPKLAEGARIAVVPGKVASKLLAEYLTDKATQTLLASDRFIMLERKDLEGIREELRFQLSGDVSDDSAQSIGKMLGAEVIVSVYVDASNSLRMKAVEVESARILASTAVPVDNPAELRAISLEDGKAITVSTIEEFFSAIGPDRIIRLNPGDYDLSGGYTVKNRYVTWVDEYDGPCPVIRNVSNLTLVGDGLARLMIRPAYGWVLSFDTCTEVTLSGLTVGHTVPGYCLGGVLRFKNCDSPSVRDCDLYGSGTYGVGLERTSGFAMENARIRECTYGLATIERSEDITFSYVTFETTGEFDLIEIRSSDRVLFDSCAFRRNRGSTLISADAESRDLLLRDCAVEENRTSRFSNDPPGLRMVGTLFSDNGFPDPQ